VRVDSTSTIGTTSRESISFCLGAGGGA